MLITFVLSIFALLSCFTPSVPRIQLATNPFEFLEPKSDIHAVFRENILPVNLLYNFAIFSAFRRPGEPPIVKGHLIWGSGKDFNLHAVNFLQKAYKSYGDVFTIRLVNQYLTIINDPHSFEAMSREKGFDFDPIQKQVNWNVFSFVLKDARKMIKDTGRTVRGKFLGKGLGYFSDNLDYAYDELEAPRPLPGDTNHGAWTTDGLRQFTAKTMFNAIFNTVFGRSDDSAFNSRMVFRNFEVFHKYFNYFWLGFPKSWFPKAMEALLELCVEGNDSQSLLQKEDCSDYIRTAINFMMEKVNIHAMLFPETQPDSLQQGRRAVSSFHHSLDFLFDRFHE